MAATNDNIFRPVEIFWTHQDSDSDDAYVPGVKNVGNRRPRRPGRVRGKQTKEVKAEVPTKQPQVQNLTPTKQENAQPSSGSSSFSKDYSKNASLKDLCSEDKKRVANLIKELARVGEEREGVLKQLDEERLVYEKQIKEMLQQQEHGEHEKTGVQKQLLECQNLLSRYQEMIQGQQILAVRDQEKYQKKIDSPLRKSYDKDLDPEKFTAQPQQNSNYHPQDRHTPPRHIRESQSSVNDNGGYHSDDGYTTPKTHEQATHRKPSQAQISDNKQSPADRPFTNFIDKLIAQEKTILVDGNPEAHENLYGLGPLAAPVFSSTQHEKPVGADYEFHALQPDLSPRSSVEGTPKHAGHGRSAKDQHHHPRSVQQTGFESQRSMRANKGGTAPADTTGERRQELLQQKEALLEEQRRLQNILDEQEKKLREKQAHLHEQQALQHQRLQYFEQTGKFPTHTLYSSQSESLPPLIPVSNTEAVFRERDILSIDLNKEYHPAAATTTYNHPDLPHPALYAVPPLHPSAVPAPYSANSGAPYPDVASLNLNKQYLPTAGITLAPVLGPGPFSASLPQDHHMVFPGADSFYQLQPDQYPSVDTHSVSTTSNDHITANRIRHSLSKAHTVREVGKDAPGIGSLAISGSRHPQSSTIKKPVSSTKQGKYEDRVKPSDAADLLHLVEEVESIDPNSSLGSNSASSHKPVPPVWSPIPQPRLPPRRHLPTTTTSPGSYRARRTNNHRHDEDDEMEESLVLDEVFFVS